MPTEKDEDWKRTSLKGIQFENFKLATSRNQIGVEFPPQLVKPMADQKHGGQVLVSPWETKNSLDLTITAQGVVFEDVKTAAVNHPKLLEKVLSRIDQNKNRKFSALAGSLEINGVLLYVPKNVIVNTPLQSLYWAPGSGYVHAFTCAGLS